MRTRLRLPILAALLIVSATAVPAQPNRPITDTDLLNFVWAADPQVSPDGTQVVFVRVVVNEKSDDYDTNLMIVPADGREAPRELTIGTRDSAPRWAPDGRRLAFVRAAGGPPQIHVISLAGGEARPITDLPRGAGAPLWSPDGKQMAFSSSTKDEDFTPKTDGAPKSDVRVITSATYRSNGGGWTDPDRPSHVWVTDATPARPLAKARQVTSGRFSEGLAAWTSDGSRLYVTSSRVDEPYYQQTSTELFSVPASGGELTKVASIDGNIGGVKLSPDGRRLAFSCTFNGNPERSYDQPDLCVANADGSGTPKNLTAAYDFDINGGVGGDAAPPRGGRSAGPIWSADGASIVIVAGERGNANLVRVDAATGAVTPISKGAQTVQSYTASSNGRTLVGLVSTQTAVGDLFTFDLGAATTPRQITRLNEPLFSSLKLSEPETITWKSFDGRPIEGWLLKPPDFDPSKKYPFILEIHGGPHSAYGNVFTHEFQMLAAKGFVVLFPNPRGSSNYGQEFGNIIQYRYPGDDYKDLMAGVDDVIKRGYIDTAKLGVTGGSGGGLLTNWVVTQTTRFAAAVSQRDIADWYGFWFTADFAQFTPSWFRKAPWEDPEDYAARSPITHVGKVKTPMLFVLGDDDLRTPPGEGGEMMFRALKYLRVPTVMVRFPGETHELSRSGKPSHRLERLRHISGWFERWLLGNTALYADVK
ncbi:MAG TPA: S9 family peptidase [Vicinamibacterales bacterium]|nr:S9 family peptidase [Vicinamibacterales bacterium]